MMIGSCRLYTGLSRCQVAHEHCPGAKYYQYFISVNKIPSNTRWYRTHNDLKTRVSESIVADLHFPPGHPELFMRLHELTMRRIFSVQLVRERAAAPRCCPRHPAPLAASCHSWQPAVDDFIIFPSASCFCRDKFIFGSYPSSPIDRADKTGAWSSDK